MRFNFIPPGSMRLGLNRTEEIFINGFFMQTTEVTQQQWYSVMGTTPSHFARCGNECPVENIAYIEVEEFVRRLNQREATDKYRLPTPEEWEYACRTGKDSRFCCGNSERDLDEYAWLKKNSRERTHPVAKKKPNDWGLYDMHGNVQEWCRDYLAGLDPIARGGDFLDPPKYLSCFVQEMVSITYQRPTIGFRLVRTP
jgi:formylglycine-generating enzyme required for sulfatase activity